MEKVHAVLTRVDSEALGDKQQALNQALWIFVPLVDTPTSSPPPKTGHLNHLKTKTLVVDNIFPLFKKMGIKLALQESSQTV